MGSSVIGREGSCDHAPDWLAASHSDHSDHSDPYLSPD